MSSKSQLLTGGGYSQEKVASRLKEKVPVPVYEKELSTHTATGLQNNLLLEGDNLEWLSVLKETHAEKVDVIYIDPPYNTGNNDFVYDDSRFTEGDWRHSKWLHFMKQRLILAKELLKDDGLIFISIDDHEQAALKLLLDDYPLFGEENFIDMFLWNRSAGSSLSKLVRSDYEYVLCYAKDLSCLSEKLLGRFSDGMGDSPLYNKPNTYSTLIFPEQSIFFPNFVSGNITPFKSKNVELHDLIVIENHYNKNPVQISDKWKWSQSTLDDELSNNTKILCKTKNLRLRYQRDNAGSVEIPTKSITNEEGVKGNLSATSELQSLLGEEVDFNYPKPVSLIKYLVNMIAYNRKDALVLDFFAGSGTTAQAVMELNHEDGGSRRWILCTNNENDICRSITKPRVDALIKGEYAKSPKDPITYGGGYDYLTLDYIAKTSGNAARATLLTPPPAVVLASLVEGVPLETYENTEDSLVTFSDDKKAVIVLFQSDDAEALTEALSRFKNLDKIVLYVRYPKPQRLDALLKTYKVEVKDLKKLVAENYYRI